MPLRITTEETPRETVRVDGTLTSENVQALAEVCEAKGARLVVDLGGLLAADATGVQLLRELRDRGALLHGARPYVAMLLGSH